MEAYVYPCSIFPEKQQTRLPNKQITLQMRGRRSTMPSTDSCPPNPASLLPVCRVIELNQGDVLPLNMICSGYPYRGFLFTSILGKSDLSEYQKFQVNQDLNSKEKKGKLQEFNLSETKIKLFKWMYLNPNIATCFIAQSQKLRVYVHICLIHFGTCKTLAPQLRIG